MVYLPPNTMSLIQPLDQVVIRTFKAHYTQYFIEKTVNTMEENLHRQNIMKVWKDYTTEDAIVIEKAVKVIKPKTITAAGENCVQRLCMTSQNLRPSQSRIS